MDSERGHGMRIADGFLEMAELARRVAHELTPAVEQAGAVVSRALADGGRILACGNGGSAADAQHFVAELVGRMTRERRSLPAISLSSDPSIVTALGNDYGYEELFARQVDGLGREGDVLIAITTSGRSRNILTALDRAHQRGLSTVVLTGSGGDDALGSATVCLRVPSSNTQRIQEMHMALLHAIGEVVDEEEPSWSPVMANSTTNGELQ